jgi:hypothetical protein
MELLSTKTLSAIDALYDALVEDAHYIIVECRNEEGLDDCDIHHGLEKAMEVKTRQYIRDNLPEIMQNILEWVE